MARRLWSTKTEEEESEAVIVALVLKANYVRGAGRCLTHRLDANGMEDFRQLDGELGALLQARGGDRV